MTIEKLIKLIEEYRDLGTIGHSTYITLIKAARELQVTEPYNSMV